MSKTRLALVLAAAALTVPLAAGCSESPTLQAPRSVPTFSPDCGLLPPPDSSCLRNGQIGPGGRFCC